VIISVTTSTIRSAGNRGNSRNGVRSKTVLTEIGPAKIEVPREGRGQRLDVSAAG
jgi:hypothetical protein